MSSKSGMCVSKVHFLDYSGSRAVVRSCVHLFAPSKYIATTNGKVQTTKSHFLVHCGNVGGWVV